MKAVGKGGLAAGQSETNLIKRIESKFRYLHTSSKKSLESHKENWKPPYLKSAESGAESGIS